MTRLHTIGYKPSSGDQLYHQFMHTIRSCLMKGKLIGDWEIEDKKEAAVVGRSIYVVIADLPERVPKNKLHEQLKRDQQKKKQMERKGIEPYPSNWIVCHKGIMNPATNETFDIDMQRFHCSGREMRTKLYGYLKERFQFEPLEPNCEVWFDLMSEDSCVFRRQSAQTEIEKCELVVPFVRAGEAEVACIQYMKYFYGGELRDDESLTLITTDTDVLAMAVANTYYNRRPLLMWWNVIGGDSRPDGYVWVDRVVSRLKSKQINVMGFLGVCALMGCDYLDKSILFSGIGSEMIWDAVLPLICGQTVHGRWEWFDRFIREVYRVKRKKLTEDTALMNPPDERLKRKAFNRWVWTLRYWSTLDPGPNVHDGLEGKLAKPTLFPVAARLMDELKELGEGEVDDEKKEEGVAEGKRKLENGKWHGRKKVDNDEISSSDDLTDFEDESDRKKKKEKRKKRTADKKGEKKYKLDLVRLFDQ